MFFFVIPICKVVATAARDGNKTETLNELVKKVWHENELESVSEYAVLEAANRHLLKRLESLEDFKRNMVSQMTDWKDLDTKLINEMQDIKSRNENTEALLNELKYSYEVLKSESTALREMLVRQSQDINKLTRKNQKKDRIITSIQMMLKTQGRAIEFCKREVIQLKKENIKWNHQIGDINSSAMTQLPLANEQHKIEPEIKRSRSIWWWNRFTTI